MILATTITCLIALLELLFGNYRAYVKVNPPVAIERTVQVIHEENRGK